MEVKKKMNPNELRSLQEAYLEVVEGSNDERIRRNIKSFGSNYTPPSNWDSKANRGKGAVLTPNQKEKQRRKALRQEEVSVYDIVLSHLIDEGYADTIESAEGIMINMSEEWRDSIVEADSLAAMQARREKRLAAQRKREGTTASGKDFGRDDSLSADQQKKRREAEFKAGLG
jgi:hypothetical protein